MNKKQEIWYNIKSKYSHLENHCDIEVNGLEDESDYFHPKFVLDENTYVICQGDNKNTIIYAFRFYHTKNSITINVEFSEHLLDNIIVGWSTNKEVVFYALETLNKIRNHVQQLNNYTTDYINNILIGDSIKELTDSFINELRTTKEMVNYMQKTLNN